MKTIIWFRPSARDLCFMREYHCPLAKGETLTPQGGPPGSELVAWESGAAPGEHTRYWFLYQRDWTDGIQGWSYAERDWPAALVDPHSIRAGEPSTEPRVFSVSKVIRKSAKARLIHWRAMRGERRKRWFDFLAKVWGR